MTAAPRLALALALVALAPGCGNDSTPRAAQTGPAELSACEQEFISNREAEAAGTRSFTAFAGSVRTCASLDEWIAAEQKHGPPLQGKEATFVVSVCAEADEATKALPICKQAEQAFRRGG